MPEEHGSHGLKVPQESDYNPGGADVPRAFREFVDSLDQVLGKTQAARVSTGTLTVGGSKVVKLTWPKAFADTNYTVAISVRRASGSSPVPPVTQTFNKEAASIEVGVTNQASEAETYVVEAIAIHD